MDITVPNIGHFVDVLVIEVHVTAGDAVAAEDPLITLESDKATLDVPAPVAGPSTTGAPFSKSFTDHLLEAVESGDVFCRADIAAQLWRVSHIAQAKYRAITIGISCSALALACWGSALVLGA